MNNKPNKLLNPILIVVMGVSGCGKSTVAEAIATQYQLNLVEADNFHSEQAIARMASGRPLDDEMRGPWVEMLCQHLQDHFDNENSCVMAFSGLAKQHRDAIRAIRFHMMFIHLHANPEIIKQRSERRTSHFMPASLLESQYQALQDPSQEQDIFKVDVSQTFENVIVQATNHIETYFKIGLNQINALRRYI